MLGSERDQWARPATLTLEARQLVEALAIPAFLLGLDDRLLHANIAARTLLEANGKKITSPDWSAIPGLPRALAAAKNAGTLAMLEDVRWPGTDRQHLQLTVAPIRGADHRATAVLVTALDRSDLAEAREQYAVLWEDHARSVSSEGASHEELRTLAEALKAANDDLERRVQELAAAQRADTQKNQFLAMLAHELRNPLAAVANALHVLRRVIGDDRRAHQALRVADRQLRHEARLLDDLLDVSRIVLGKITIQTSSIDLRDCVRAAVDSVGFAAEPRAIALVVELGGAPLMIRGDATRLEQCVANLVSNAIKFTPPGGRVEVRAEPSDGMASVRVQDTGVGIPAGMLERIFELFTQADTSLAHAQGGLGIGLTLSRRLIEMHHGTITARSPGPTQGSIFEIRIPLDHATTGEAAAVETARPHRPHRLLIVEDNRDARAALRMVLELEGHTVLDTGDGASGVRLAVEQTPDAVLLDIGLPDTDGFEAAERIRRRLGPRVRLVALSGYGDDETQRRAREAGFDAYLVKPVAPADLIATIDAL